MALQEKLFHKPAPAAELLIQGAHILDPRVGIDAPHDILIRKGRIAQLGDPGALDAEATAPAVQTVAGTGKHVFPAFVDPHVHLRTPGQEYKESLDTGTAAGAAGGFCQLIAMPNTAPVVDTVTVLRSLAATAAQQARVPTGFLASITVGLGGSDLSPMAALADTGALGFTDDGKPVSSAGVLRRALQYQRLAGRVIALHEEDPTLSGAGVMHEGAVSARLGIAGIPSISESTMVARDCALALYENARVHFQHLSCAESVDALVFWRQRGARVSAEVTPHHLTLIDDAACDLDTRFKMNPPLRTEVHRQAVIDGLRSGIIDCVATDHAPHAAYEKEMSFEEAPMGTTGLETSFPAIYTELVKPGILRLPLVIERMTAGGGLYGLPIPRIEVGAKANIVLVDLGSSFTVGAGGYASRSENCCFHGRVFSGVVEMTIAAGALVYERGSEANA